MYAGYAFYTTVSYNDALAFYVLHRCILYPVSIKVACDEEMSRVAVRVYRTVSTNAVGKSGVLLYAV